MVDFNTERYKKFDIMLVETIEFHNGEPVNFVKQITTKKITEHFSLTRFKEYITPENISKSSNSSRRNLETIWKIMVCHAKEIPVVLFRLVS